MIPSNSTRKPQKDGVRDVGCVNRRRIVGPRGSSDLPIFPRQAGRGGVFSVLFSEAYLV